MTSESPLAVHETIAGVTARVEEWIGLGAPGIVWIRHVSDVSRDLLLSRLSVHRPIQRIDFQPPDPSQAADWLERELSATAKADSLPVAAVLFPPSFDDRPDGIACAFRSLNLRREAVSRAPLVQLWCVPLTIAPQAESEAPDLASWFQLKMTLTEAVPGPATPAEEAVLSRWRSRSETLESLLAAVQRQRRLVESESESYLPSLAAALNNLSVKLAGEGRREEALAHAEEAVRIYRQRQAFPSNLALALNNQAIRQIQMGKEAEALASIEEAMRNYRDLAATNPEAFLPDLAMAANNQANVESLVGMRAEALASIQEAVRHYRELVAANRQAFLSDLAGALSNQANVQGAMGKQTEALASSAEAVQYLGELVAANREAFLPDLALSHGTLGNVLLAAARPAEAVAALSEGIRLITPLARALPQAHLPLALKLAQAYVQACEIAGIVPDPELTWPLDTAPRPGQET